MRVRAALVGAHRLSLRRGPGRRAAALTAATALVAGLTIALVDTPANAAQAPGDDLTTWSPGWSWTYATVFHYVDPVGGTDASINENVTYTNAGIVTHDGQSAYQINLSGTITGGSGSANIPGTGTVSLKSFSGSVSGSEFIRRSDLAVIEESQHQQLHATASLSIISTGVDAVIDMALTPSPAWKGLSFPLNNGDSWHENTNVAYTGGFSYTSSLANGSSPFDGTFPFVATSTVAAPQNINVPINSSLSTDAVTSVSSDGTTADNVWFAPGFKNVAKEHLQVPLDTASLSIDRSLSSASTPAPATTLSETITPSLTCAGASAVVAGHLSSGASGVPLTVTLDESAITPGQTITANTSTTSGGNYSATLTSPGGFDGLTKSGARGTWGVLVDGGSASSVATLVVNNQDCTSLTYTGDTSGSVNTNGTVSATLTDLSTGAGVVGQTVSFALSGGASVNASTGTAGIATVAVPLNTPVRTATVGVTFAGNASLASASTSGSIVIGKDATSTSVLASPLSVTAGDPVTFTATVTPVIGSNPTGSVQFSVDGSAFGAAVPLTGASASSAPFSSSVLGNHTVTASYLGDAAFAGSTSPTVTFKVHVPLTPTTTTLSTSSSSAAFGQSVTLTATVAPQSGSGHPSGSVTFTDGTTTLGPAAVTPGVGGDQATVTTDSLAVGSHAIVATYSGDDVFDSSVSAPASQIITQANTTTAVVASDSTTVTGEGVTYTATVTAVAPAVGEPVGDVQLNVDGVPTGDPVALSGGSAFFPAVTSLGAGSHTITVVYSGSTNFAASTGTTTQEVLPAQTATQLTVAPIPSAENQSVTFTATVVAVAPGSGSPTGTVIFTVDGTDTGASTLSAGQATLSTSALTPGGHAITSRFVGDTNYSGSASDEIDTTVIEGSAVAATTTTVTSSINPSTFGQPITFTATVATVDPDSPAGSPAGAVQFTIDGTNLGDPVPLVNGVAVSPTLASPEPGDHLVIADYQPNALFSSSGDTLTQTIANAGVDVALTSTDASSDYGQSVHFHATVSSPQAGTGQPTGSVQFRVDGVALGTAVALSGGAADSAAIADLAPGTHNVTALYSGSLDFVPGSATLDQAVNVITTATTLASSANPSTYGDSVTFTATVTPGSNALGAPTGSITFSDGATTLGTAPVVATGNLGKATLTIATLGAGVHSIKATYGGSAAFAASTSSTVNQTVNKAATSIDAEAAILKIIPLGLPLGTLRATLSTVGGPLAGVPLVFKIGSLTACTVTTDANGVATCSALKYVLNLVLALGYKVSFAGDANHLPSSASAGLIK